MLEATWRWFGPNDPISLRTIRQAGATGIVTALHDLPNGAVWPTDAIQARKRSIEDAGLRWSVVESVPVHEAIKTGRPEAAGYLDAYRQTLQNLGACGVTAVCYNLMPAVDWTRTDLAVRAPDGAETLRFDMVELAAFDRFVLEREGSDASYTDDVLARAEAVAAQWDAEARDRIQRSVLAGLPGAEESWSTAEFRDVLGTYAAIDGATYRRHAQAFLEAVIPTAEAAGVRLAVHPDDPPFSLFGLPRVVSTLADVQDLTAAVPSLANGVTFCAGSFGARADNDLPAMARALGERIHFVHLRNVRRDPDGSFDEQHHLDGDLDLPGVLSALLDEEDRRLATGRPDAAIPWRPDHGLRMLDDLDRQTNPGYSTIGRLKGLAEMKGLEVGLRHAR